MRGGASAGETDEPDAGLSPLGAGAEEDQRAVGRGETLARVPPLSAARAPAGHRRGLSDGVAAQCEETVETDAGSGIAHGLAGVGRAGKVKKGAGTLQHERELSEVITLYRHQRWSFLKQLFVNSLLAA